MRKNRTALISMISSHLEWENLKELEDKGTSELLCLQDKINEYCKMPEPLVAEIVLQTTDRAKELQNEPVQHEPVLHFNREVKNRLNFVRKLKLCS